MIKHFRILPFLLLVLAGVPFLSAQPESDAPPSPASADLDALFEGIIAELRGGANQAEDLQRHLGSLDELMAKYAGQQSEDVARIAFMRATFIEQVMKDADGAISALNDLVAAMPDTEVAGQAKEYAAMIEAKQESEKRLAGLIGSPAPELDFTWATDDGLNQLSDLKGKVVVLDFWATWCGPCVRSFPQVRELTEHYADSAVEVVGVTSLQGRVHGLETAPIDVRNDPAKEHSLMNDYIAKMDINWTIAFSQQEVFNPDYGVTGIPHMAIIAPDGTVRHRGLHPAMPHAEKTAMIDALLAEFDLPVPGA